MSMYHEFGSNQLRTGRKSPTRLGPRSDEMVRSSGGSVVDPSSSATKPLDVAVVRSRNCGLSSSPEEAIYEKSLQREQESRKSRMRKIKREEEKDDSHRNNSKEPSSKRRRRSREHRRNGHRRRQRSSSFYAEEKERIQRNGALVHRQFTAGIVSDDEEHAAESKSNRRSSLYSESGDRKGRNNRNRSPSIHDDTVGHFQGGSGIVIANRYRIEHQIGLGTFGKVVECLDLQAHRHHRDRGDNYVAIKIVRNVKRYCESAKIEADIVGQINRRGGRGRTHCVILHDAFSFSGHYCLVFERLGPSLYDFMKRHDYRPFPMICIQDFAVQLLETMEFLHSFGLVHTDLKIENILLTTAREVTYRNQRVPKSTLIKLIDFGGACYDVSKKSSVINTRQYRAPEVILEAGWSMPSDMWSLGCILAELYKGELLFPTHENIEHLALIERVLGPFPRSILKRATKFVDEVFDGSGRISVGQVLSTESFGFVKNFPYLQSVVRNPEDAWFLRLLFDLLRIDPEKRSTAHECLRYLARINRDVVRCA